jgi:hypothetical protein
MSLLSCLNRFVRPWSSGGTRLSSYHAAALYVDGQLSRSFGEDDDVWVPYNDNSELVVDQGSFNLRELDPDIEYDVLKGALDFGFEALGRGTAEELRNAIAEWD